MFWFWFGFYKNVSMCFERKIVIKTRSVLENFKIPKLHKKKCKFFQEFFGKWVTISLSHNLRPGSFSPCITSKLQLCDDVNTKEQLIDNIYPFNSNYMILYSNTATWNSQKIHNLYFIFYAFKSTNKYYFKTQIPGHQSRNQSQT
jgi:hypothetical protein